MKKELDTYPEKAKTKESILEEILNCSFTNNNFRSVIENIKGDNSVLISWEFYISDNKYYIEISNEFSEDDNQYQLYIEKNKSNFFVFSFELLDKHFSEIFPIINQIDNQEEYSWNLLLSFLKKGDIYSLFK